MFSAVRTVPRMCKFVVPKRNHAQFIGSAVSGPPRVRISFAEKMVHAAAMNFFFILYPTWVLLNMEYYKGNE